MNSGANPFKKWALVSIALNLVLLGLVIGVLLRPVFMPPPMFRGMMMEDMPEHGRKLARAAFEDIHRIHRDSRAAFEKAHDELTKTIEADPFRPGDFDAASKKIRDVNTAMLDKIAARMARLMQELTPEERDALANHIRDLPPPPPGPPGFGGPMMGPMRDGPPPPP